MTELPRQVEMYIQVHSYRHRMIGIESRILKNTLMQIKLLECQTAITPGNKFKSNISAIAGESKSISDGSIDSQKNK